MEPPKPTPLYCTFSHREPLPPSLRGKFRNLDQFLRELSASASIRLFIVAPYLSPAGMSLLKGGLAASAQRGAWIRIVTGDLSDEDGMNRRAIAELIDGEIGQLIRQRLRVLTCSSTLPTLIHAKILLVDRKSGYLGSANISRNAMEKNFELGMALDPSQAAALDDLFTFLEAQGHLSEFPDLVAQ